MKVLQINVSNSGSTGAIANSIHRRLLRDGAESRFLYARGPKTTEPAAPTQAMAPTQSVQTAPERYVNALLSRLSGRVGCFGKKSTDRILEKMETFHPDVVHLHNLHGYYADIFRLLEFLKERKIKTVLTLHDEFLFTGRCAFSGDCEKWRVNSPGGIRRFESSKAALKEVLPPSAAYSPGAAGGCGNCPRMGEYPAALLDKSRALWLLKQQVFSEFHTLTVVSPSRWLADRAKESILSGHPICVIPNGIEPGTFYPGENSVRDEYEIKEERVVLAAAQNIMSGRKGGEYVLKLAETMPKTRFLIVGAQEEVLCPPNVTLIPGKQSPEEMANLYRGADVFLITSREDNFPTVCLEAAACGTPVAGFASGGAPETVSPKVSNFVPFGDVAALKSAVKELFLLDNKEQNAKQFSGAAEEMYQAYRRIYLLN
ncbi:glycosyltransferase [Congzhengia minquanensis]|uniref:Glycosyltransferase n=1 Tax=Congzhengia minquanensis TaxID=2763657 RepID=A0A926HZ97_9FIRM|nr:glycosyltransferase [Congzhengia minquanensis]MBC8540935.1 glycosyltransferase [Congzhengia minquanensis]